MFQKSILILCTCVIVALAIVLGWVAFQVSGPKDAIARARALVASGKYGEAIGVLDTTERDLVNSGERELLGEVWRLRYRSFAEIGSPSGALLDLQQLLQGPARDDEQLQLEQIRLLALDGQGPRALLAAQAFLAKHPDHDRALELAGEACQTIYQPMLREVRESIEREVTRIDHDGARRTLLAYVYRPDGDPEVERARERLEELFATDPRRVALWPPLQRRLVDLRGKVQEGLGYFARSLEGGDQPVAAFRAVATALEQSGRIDDLLMACEIQRRRFNHSYVEESGQRAAWARIQAGLPQAAIATVDRWLPQERIDALLADQQFGPSHEDLILARTVAAWKLFDRRQLDENNQRIAKIREAGVRLDIALHISLAARRIERDNRDPDRIEQSLDILCDRLLRVPPAIGRPDLGAEFARLRADWLVSQNAPDAKVQAALQEWRDARPDDVQPIVRIADFLCTTGKTSAAFAALDEAAELDPRHPALFDIRLRAARRHFEGGAKDGPALLASCIKRGEFEPEVSDPIGYVLCSEAALALSDWRVRRIAAACAQQAVEAFPTANLPRQLELRSLLNLGRPAEADRAADAALLAVVPDAETFRLAVEAKRAAGTSMRSLVRAAMAVVVDSSTLSPELVRIALEDAPASAAIFVTDQMTAADAPVASRLLAIRALAAGERGGEALALLEQLPAPNVPVGDGGAPLRGTTTDAAASVGGDELAAPELPPAVREQLLGTSLAFAACLRAAAEQRPDDALLPFARAHYDRLRLADAPPAALFAVAAELAGEHPRTAYAVLSSALGDAAPAERSGAQFALAGDLAIRLGLVARAEEHWTAALGFDGGHVVAEDLARLLLVFDRDVKAARVYRLVQNATDPALAARFGRLDLATPLIGVVLQQDPVDLITQATLATFGQSPLLDWTVAPAELQTDRLELLACMRNPHLSGFCTPRAQALVSADPASMTNYLLLARTMVDAGQVQLAAMLHGQAYAGGHRTPVLWREVAYAGSTQPAYDPGPILFDRVTVAATKGDVGGSALTRRWGIQQFVGAFEKAGLLEQAEEVKVLQWLVAPDAMQCTPAALELISTRHTAVNACVILDKVLHAGNSDDPRAVLDRFYEMAGHLVQKEPRLAPVLAQLASGHLQLVGPVGPVVHFLLRHAPPPKPMQLLDAHLTAVATGADDARFLHRTVDAMRARTSVETTLDRIEELLDEHPTAMPLWGERAGLHARLLDGARALAELRTVLAHAPDPHSKLTFVTLAAFERRLTPADITELAELPPDLLQTPAGRFAQGVVAMRSGDTQAARTALADAPSQDDGSDLFAAAFVSLQSDDDDAVVRAREALERLARDYPSSTFARHAGSFVRQLSPRAASADDSDTNR